MLPRRAVLAATASLLACPAPATGIDQPEWDAFKFNFFQPDGRIVDTGNANVSHTEGQGWGMLFAEYFNDPAVFAALWGWTSRTLKRPNDALHAWRYEPQAANKVSDPNNATDGDLLLAMSLSRAARRWNMPAYAAAASAIATDVLRLLVRRHGARLLLLPGAAGFEQEAGTVLNPSYYVFPAFPELATRHPSPLWAELQRDGLTLLAEGRFGRWSLPPDWLLLDRTTGKFSPAPSWPPRFSYDAIRVPLYTVWGKLAQQPGFTDYAQANAGKLPAWTDLTTGAVAPYAAPPGMVAVAMLATGTGQDLPPGFPTVSAAPDYYSAALVLLARIAWRESRA